MSSSAARYFPREFGEGTVPTRAEAENVRKLSTATAHECDQESSPSTQERAAIDSLATQAGPSDEVLMARTVDGDKEALGCLFRRYARLVRAVEIGRAHV